MKNTMKANCDSDWQAECDARTLMDARVIKKDPKRLEKAMEYAKAKAQQYKGVVADSMVDDMDDDD